jgi:lipopolysaccharide transport system ATP-binding protein
MSDTVITVQNLSKRYLLGHESLGQRQYTSLREVIGRGATVLGRRIVDLSLGRQIIQGDNIEEFWALKDVSFTIKRGAVVGIIGRNGAGKSTLLKILSRITEPTKGRLTIEGRIATLLEVGTGFHPELTGKENIYLNGAILGMKRGEIRQKFDEIVAFAEVERFIDTPVKRFSSGMYVRLAFAVAAHLEPEILVVDEVLAVGDVAFQKKCLGKMGEVAGAGRTVLMVSHNVHAIRALCNTTIVLENGSLLYFGNTDQALKLYENSGSSGKLRIGHAALHNMPRSSPRDPRIQLLTARLKQDPTLGLPFTIDIEVQVSERISSVVFGVGFCSRSEVRILSSDSDYSGFPPFSFVPGRYIVSCTFSNLPLAPGDYLLDVGCRSSGLTIYDEVKGVFSIEVLPPKDAQAQFLQKFSTSLAKTTWESANDTLVSAEQPLTASDPLAASKSAEV